MENFDFTFVINSIKKQNRVSDNWLSSDNMSSSQTFNKYSYLGFHPICQLNFILVKSSLQSRFVALLYRN